MNESKPAFPLAYRVVLVATVVETLLIFSRQLSFRATHTGWKLYTSDAVLESPTIDLHALTALLWLGIFLVQFELGRRLVTRGASPTPHRRLGRAITFALVPLMSALSLAALWLNPLGLSTYLVATVSVMWLLSTIYFVVGVLVIRRGLAQLHADVMFMAFVTLAAVSTYRVVLVLCYLATGMFMTTLPIAVSWIVTLTKIGAPLAMHGRIRANGRAIALFAAVAAGFLAWGIARGLLTAVPPPVLLGAS
ncbi:MAG: hypothetical protein R3B09_17530 [Nannocystaceae bacterium]